ncbi:MAG: hypothetical protein WC455_20710 [Dehalococcoidia bacterium]|jgi:hypothetical protein
MSDWLNNLALPKGTDLALWWIGTLGLTAIMVMADPKEVILTLGGGLVGYLSGQRSAQGDK